MMSHAENDAEGADSAAGKADSAANGAADPLSNVSGADALDKIVIGPEEGLGGDLPSLGDRIKTLVIGKPRDLQDKSVFSHISLVAFLAWVGLGADGLSSSCYGPAEAFANLGEHRYLAIFLAAAIVATVFVISACYSHIIEAFPSGGGGYLVASKLLGRPVGVFSGCALLVDYVLTITVSIAAAGDATFGLLGPHWHAWKLPAEFAAIFVLIVLNLRGVKESVQLLMPIFILFLVSHLMLIFGTIGMHVFEAGRVTREIAEQMNAGLNNPSLGLFGMLALLLHAYSLGAGTYTGLEAVSNSMPVMREPRVANGKRTMMYMAVSLSITAAGLVVAYLLLGIRAGGDKTMNHVLALEFAQEIGLENLGWGGLFVLIVLLSEGTLLVVAAQAGFIDGPRVLANMAHDSWTPRWFANLSERLATHNGVLLMGISALAALVYTGGDVSALVIMYSINVFLTFSLSMVGMCRYWFHRRGEDLLWRRRLALFVLGSVMCISILVVTVYQKFFEGGWRTIALTSLCVVACFLIHRYYRRVGEKLARLNETLGQLTFVGQPNLLEPDPARPTAVILVGGYSGLGIHTVLNAVRLVPDYFENFVFVSVGVVDSGSFKGSGAVEDLHKHTEESLRSYVALGQRLGVASTSFMGIGTDAVEGLEELCRAVVRQFPRSLIFAGQLVFQKDTWLHRFLHNQTAYALQRRLQWAGLSMVILPTRVR